FGLAAFAGLAVAVIFTQVRPLRPFMELLIELVRPLPPVSWIPLAILWFGLGNAPAYFIVFLGAFFPVFVNVCAGLESVDPHLVLMARAFGATRRKIFWAVQLPSMVPYIFAGMRAGLGVAWMSVITAEMIGAQSGLGYRIQLSRVTLQIENVIIGMILI